MVILHFTPIRAFCPPLQVLVVGDVLTINGESEDFTDMPDGSHLPGGAIASEWITSQGVSRIDGVLHVHLRLPFGEKDGPFEPGPLAITADGPVDLPAPDISGRPAGPPVVVVPFDPEDPELP